MTLPGEMPTNKVKAARQRAWEEIRSLRRDIGRLRDILRLSVTTEKDKREERLREFLDSLEDSTTASELGSATFKGLDNPKYATSPELWEQHCQKFYDEAECIVSTRFSEWRKRTRRRSASWKDWGERRDYAGGKSVWMLEYLEAVRKLILSWNLRAENLRPS